jgi:hypothetical protein
MNGRATKLRTLDLTAAVYGTYGTYGTSGPGEAKKKKKKVRVNLSEMTRGYVKKPFTTGKTTLGNVQKSFTTRFSDPT